MTDFGFFTGRGERLAATLVDGICIDVEAGEVSRKGALDRLAGALEAVSQIDGSAADADIVHKVVLHVSEAFQKGGMLPITAELLFLHAAERRRVYACATLPVLASRASSALGKVEEALGEVRALGLPFSVSPVPPWDDDYGHEEEQELGIWMRAPTEQLAENRWAVGCIVLGKDASQHLDFLLADREPAKVLFRLMPDLDETLAMPVLFRLGEALHEAGMALAEAPVSERMSLSPCERGIVLTWDGMEASPGMPLPSSLNKVGSRKLTLPESAFGAAFETITEAPGIRL